MAENSALPLSFSELFCEANPYYVAPYEEEVDEYNESEGSSNDSDQEKAESETTKGPTVISVFPHLEPEISANARDPVACFDFDSRGASTKVAQGAFEWNPDWKKLRDFLRLEGRLSIEAALELVKRTRSILQREPNVICLRPPYTLVGDVHGQYYDLLSMFERVGDPSETNYLFLGDYVDRGMFGCEIVFLLCALKLNFPSSFHMIRGNHECRLLTSHFTFLREVTKKYKSQRLYDEIMLLFDALPLAVLLEDEESRFLCVHGGLSPDIKTIEDIEAIERFQEPGKSGALCDLLWSDPIEEDTADGLSASDMKEWFEVTYVENASRGCGWIFGYAATREFIDTNGITAIIRAHEVQRAGYGFNKFQKPEPLVITVFSAPNYCDFYANKAAVMKISPPRYDTGDEQDEHTRLEFIQFDCVPHPFWLPKLQNGIEYTLPFLAEKMKQMLAYLISTRGLGKESDEESQFYTEIDEMLKKREEERQSAQSSSSSSSSTPQGAASGASTSNNATTTTESKPASVRIPRTPSKRGIGLAIPGTNAGGAAGGPISPRGAEKQFLSVKDRINMLNKDVESKRALVKRLTETRGGLIEGKILQTKIQAYLTKATTKFQKAKQQDWINEARPNENDINGDHQ